MRGLQNVLTWAELAQRRRAVPIKDESLCNETLGDPEG
jgi:hypothetical protein